MSVRSMVLGLVFKLVSCGTGFVRMFCRLLPNTTGGSYALSSWSFLSRSSWFRWSSSGFCPYGSPWSDFSAWTSYSYWVPHVMRCSKPYFSGVREYGCGQCGPCRVNRRRQWVARLLLESRSRESSVFVTLTYDEASCPGILVPRHYQLFLKRLRKAISPLRISYYLVGEYGGQTSRPHFHAVLFGYPQCRFGLLVAAKVQQLMVSERILLDSWGHGNIHVAQVNSATMTYACKHLTKVVVEPLCDGPQRPREFARMSTNPAIGLRALDAFTEYFTSRQGSEVLSTFDGHVPPVFRIDGANYPFGKYLHRKLRLSVGFNGPVPSEPLSEEETEFLYMSPADRALIRGADADKAKFWESVKHTRSSL